MPDVKRRDFLKIATTALLGTSGLLGMAELLRFMSHVPHPAPRTRFDLGPAENYPPGSRSVVADGAALLAHTENGFHALSLVCTHLGCTVEPQNDGFACPCHASVYAGDGSLVRGPANKPLQTLRVETDVDGHLILYTTV